MIADNALLLHQSPYFQDLGADDLALIQGHAYRRDLVPGETIVLQGQPAEALYLVDRGRVRVYASTPEGREQVLYVARAGDTFNDVAAFDGGANVASAQAVDPDTSIWVVPAHVLRQLLLARPHLGANAVSVLAGRVRRLADLVAELSLCDATQRVAKLLLEESAASSEVSLTREEIAARVGTVREVVSRVLGSLERSGAITRDNNHSVRVDTAMLYELLDRICARGVVSLPTAETTGSQ